jgi:hypothetical protein
VLLVSRRDLWIAPEEDGGVLVDPPLERAEELLEINRRRLDGAKFRLRGQPFPRIREQFREHARAAASLLWSPFAKHERLGSDSPIIACGHQPELFHPGVWIKTFAAHHLAERLGSLPLHVSVDSDLVKETAVRIPIYDAEPEKVTVKEIWFDTKAQKKPYFHYLVRHYSAFRNFSSVAQTYWKTWGFKPILPNFWREVVSAFEAGIEESHQNPRKIDGPNEGACFSAGRRKMESDWGCRVHEVLASHLDTRIFVAQVIADLPRFQLIYNECTKAYRQKYGIRSRTHPVPDLGKNDEYLEAPFWWVDVQSNRRHPLFVRAWDGAFDLTPDPGVAPVRIQMGTRAPFSELTAQGIRIFTRALTTTMFLRLCVADLFIHGIGGAKYDELTDDIIRRYFGIEPPEYMVVSGTLRLPFEDKLFPRFGCWNPRRKARDVLWNPQRYITSDNRNARQLMLEKQHWIEQEPADAAGRRERFYQLHNLTMRLRDYVTEHEKQAEADLQRCEAEVAANKILTNREYSFVLYPEEKLRPFLTQFLK